MQISLPRVLSGFPSSKKKSSSASSSTVSTSSSSSSSQHQQAQSLPSPSQSPASSPPSQKSSLFSHLSRKSKKSSTAVQASTPDLKALSTESLSIQPVDANHDLEKNLTNVSPLPSPPTSPSSRIQEQEPAPKQPFETSITVPERAAQKQNKANSPTGSSASPSRSNHSNALDFEIDSHQHHPHHHSHHHHHQRRPSLESIFSITPSMSASVASPPRRSQRGAQYYSTDRPVHHHHRHPANSSTVHGSSVASNHAPQRMQGLQKGFTASSKLSFAGSSNLSKPFPRQRELSVSAQQQHQQEENPHQQKSNRLLNKRLGKGMIAAFVVAACVILVILC